MATHFLTSIFGATTDIHVAKKQLSYPLYGADFDPLNHHFLLVGGGGGSSSTGVPNRISLLDTSNRSEIREVSDIELAPDEDSVTSLAVADSNPQSLLAYAGINSSEKDQKAGKNEHFRSFRVALPPRRKKDDGTEELHISAVGKTNPLAKSAIFRSATGPKNECYQRVLRLSPPIVEGTEKASKKLKSRLTTIGSALATQNELITLPAEDAPSAKQALSRINLETQEAADADLINVDDAGSSYALAYSTDTELFVQQLSGGKGATNPEPVKVYETQTGPVGRSKIRAIRWLNARYLLVLQNRVGRSGVELMIFKVSKDFAQTQQVLVKYLKHMKQAVGLDTCALSKAADGSQQFVIAIAGQDSSLQIQTVDYVAGSGITSFKQYADNVEVHSGPITRIVFSKFIPPSSTEKSMVMQYIRLATVGVDKNVVVQTMPLSVIPQSRNQKTNPRYVLVIPVDTGKVIYSLFKTLMYTLLVILMVLSFLEFRGAIPTMIGASKYLPQHLHDRYGRAYPGWIHKQPGPVVAESMPEFESVIDQIKLSEATPVIEKLEEISDRIKMAAATPVIEKLQEMQSSIPSLEEVQDTLADLVSQKNSEDEHKNKAVIIRDLEHEGGDVSAELKHEADIVKEGTLKKWEQLTGTEQKTWKAKLKEAGQWTEKQGETVLKGVFFGQVGGLVAEFVRGG